MRFPRNNTFNHCAYSGSEHAVMYVTPMKLSIHCVFIVLTGLFNQDYARAVAARMYTQEKGSHILCIQGVSYTQVLLHYTIF